MKRKSFRLLTAALAVTGLLALAGCGKKDPYTTYEEANKKTSELKSMAAVSDMKMKMSVDGEAMDLSMKMDMKIQNPSSEEMTADISMDMDLLGQSMSMQSYYSDGYYYMDSNGAKIKYPMDISDMEKQLASSSFQTELTKEDFKEISMKKENDNQVISYTLSGDSMSSIVDNTLSTLGDALNGTEMDMKISDIKGASTVNKDGYFSDVKMTLPLTMTVQGQEVTLDMELSMTYTDPGKDVTVELPSDLDTYQEIDMNAPANGDTGLTEEAGEAE